VQRCGSKQFSTHRNAAYAAGIAQRESFRARGSRTARARLSADYSERRRAADGRHFGRGVSRGRLPIVARERGALVVEINPNPTPLSATADVPRAAAGILLPALVDRLACAEN
jgi:hypothetical protein